MTKKDIAKLGVSARRGARLLDKLRPRWWEELDRDALRLESRYQCVLGQLFGDYEVGLSKLYDLLPVDSWRYDDRCKYGFSLVGGPFSQAWSLLTEAWLVEIRKRMTP